MRTISENKEVRLILIYNNYNRICREIANKVNKGVVHVLRGRIKTQRVC